MKKGYKHYCHYCGNDGWIFDRDYQKELDRHYPENRSMIMACTECGAHRDATAISYGSWLEFENNVVNKLYHSLPRQGKLWVKVLEWLESHFDYYYCE